jgi:arylsulfatase A-like enzyme
MALPNILLIHSDQHRFDCVGVNGHPLLKTPNLDRLAAGGANFTHAFCVAPICVASRVSLLTGAWPTRHGCLFNYDAEVFHPPDDSLPVFPMLLREQGYHLSHVGKWQAHPKRSPLDYGFHDFVGDGEYAPWREKQGIPPVPHGNKWFGQTDPHIRPEQHHLAWAADRVIGVLEARAAEGKPFLVRWDPYEPHLPCVPPEPYASMYPPEKIAPWQSFAETFVGKPYIQRQQLRTWKIDHWTWSDWAPVVGRYLAVVTLMDHQIGRVLDAMDRLGLSDNTLVIYTTDHGDLCGGHRMIDKHFVMYDDVTRVPLIARWPGRIPAGRPCDGFASSALDVACTICQAGGVRPPKTFVGQDLIALARGEGLSPRQDVFAVWYGSQFGLYSQRMVRDRRWKYVWNATAEDELYDLQTDPGELRNLAADPACASELARLRQRLVSWMESTEDRLLNQWTRPQIAEGRKGD